MGSGGKCISFNPYHFYPEVDIASFNKIRKLKHKNNIYNFENEHQ